MKDILVTYEDGVQVLMFNRPTKKNPIGVQTCLNIIDALTTASTRDDVKITLITGSGEYFSSGFEFLGDSGQLGRFYSVEEFTTVFRNLIASAIDYPKPLIALVNGPAIGLGVTFLGLCDIVYALENATFRTPFASLSLVPEGCSSYIFPRVMGPSMASQMLFFNYTMSANEAKSCNFVAKVLTTSEVPGLLKKIKEWAKTPLEILLVSKKLTRNQDRRFLHQVNQNEVNELTARIQSEDFVEAISNLMMRKKAKKSKL